ncbi:hypothetical protein I8H83_04385 [Candidatus Saccharibacteria bacterium]|nr:hypothetical protein [Candidatus Saccharibacteria bacterium]MBH2007817.1 hypothetical protein [Candidatus Saccharibacteria bacterium]
MDTDQQLHAQLADRLSAEVKKRRWSTKLSTLSIRRSVKIVSWGDESWDGDNALQYSECIEVKRRVRRIGRTDFSISNKGELCHHYRHYTEGPVVETIDCRSLSAREIKDLLGELVGI